MPLIRSNEPDWISCATNAGPSACASSTDPGSAGANSRACRPPTSSWPRTGSSVRRAVEQTSAGPPTLKTPKNGKTRTTIFPKSLANDLGQLVAHATAVHGPTGLLFPNRQGGIARRSAFQQIWIKAAAAADWPMTAPLRRTAGYGKHDKGWRWTGAAQWTVHDLRHVAACWMLFDLGLDPAIVAEKLGHADPAFTIKRYVGIRGNPDERATQLTDGW